jgi:hypothetical protein
VTGGEIAILAVAAAAVVLLVVLILLAVRKRPLGQDTSLTLLQG